MDYGKPACVLIAMLAMTACTEPQTSVGEETSPVPLSLRNWLDGTSQPEPTKAAATKPVPPVRDMIDGLAAKLENSPNDRPGWELLARSYAFVGDMPRARDAAERALALGADAKDLHGLLKPVRGQQSSEP